jgi:hypothetical protein
VSGEINGHAPKSGSRKCLTETKELLFRAGESVRQQRDGMRAWVRGEGLKRRSVPGEGHGLDTDARLETV